MPKKKVPEQQGGTILEYIRINPLDTLISISLCVFQFQCLDHQLNVGFLWPLCHLIHFRHARWWKRKQDSKSARIAWRLGFPRSMLPPAYLCICFQVASVSLSAETIANKQQPKPAKGWCYLKIPKNDTWRHLSDLSALHPGQNVFLSFQDWNKLV